MLISNLKRIWQRFHIYIIVFTTYYALISYIVITFYDYFYFSTSINFYLSFFIFSIGYTIKGATKSRILKLMAFFSLSACAMGLYSVLKNVGTFQVLDIYAILLKNSSGVILTLGILFSITIAVNTSPKTYSLFWCIVSLILFASLLTFRARSATIGILSVGAIVCCKVVLSRSSRKIIVLSILGIIYLLVSYGIISLDMLFDSLTSNKDITNAEDFSSGRTVMFDIALQYFNRDPIAGAMSTTDSIRSIDNAIINILGRYGFIGLLTQGIPYFYVWFITLKNIVIKSTSQAIPYYALLILCIVSLTEAPFPFGPGTACMGAYLILGLFNNPFLHKSKRD